MILSLRSKGMPNENGGVITRSVSQKIELSALWVFEDFNKKNKSYETQGIIA